MTPGRPGSVPADAAAARPAQSNVIRRFAEEDHHSVVGLIQQLVRVPSRGGLDPYEEIIGVVSGWLNGQGLPARYLHDEATGRPVGVVCDVRGGQAGPRYVLNACLDTAPFGDPDAWRHAPTSGTIDDGWLYGRGSADSKAAVAIFGHLAARVRAQAEQLHGTLTLLFDCDEHTGLFSGAKRYFAGQDAPDDVAGVMIGYPGAKQIVVGGRGFLRLELTVRGTAGHTGSKRSPSGNAIEKAAGLVRTLAEHRTPSLTDPVLGLPPKLTVTKISGGESYSIIPDRCTLAVDARLTTSFDELDARDLVKRIATQVDEQWPSSQPTSITFHESWPAYVLDEEAPIRHALTSAAHQNLPGLVLTKVAGPSNIGNYLAQLGIDATAGLGVRYEGLHGTDERIDLATIPAIQSTYHEAILTLLSA
jgi:succinyl-diaminopimelate desuccinylase